MTTAPSPAPAANVPLYMAALGFPAVVLAAALAQPHFAIHNLLRDPLVLAMEAPSVAECCSAHYGAISNLGVLLWLSTAAICLFAGVLLSSRGDLKNARFMILGGSLSMALGVDDWLMLHDYVMPLVGIRESAVMGGLAAIALIYVCLSHREILRQRPGLFLLAGMFLAGSVVADLLPLHHLPVPAVVIEDGAKLFGISCWAAFHIAAAAFLLGDFRPDANRKSRSL